MLMGLFPSFQFIMHSQDCRKQFHKLRVVGAGDIDVGQCEKALLQKHISSPTPLGSGNLDWPRKCLCMTTSGLPWAVI